MFPMPDLPDLADDLFHQPQTTAETLHSDYDIRDDIFAHATSVERSVKFLPKPRINNKRNPPIPSKTCAFEGASSTSQFPDTADGLMFPMPDLGDDLFHQGKTTAETLHSDSDIQDEIFAHATSIERSSKFLPKPHINNNKKSPMLSKTSVFEGPSSTSKFPDAADETLHFDSDIQDEIFAHATSIERSGKFIPKPHINTNKKSPMLSKTSVFEGPSSTSKFPDVADETLHSDSDILDEIFAHTTSIERSGKFLPKPHINNNKNSPMLSKTSVFEGPSSTSKFSDDADETLHFDSAIQDEIFAHATSIDRSGKFLPKPRINNNKKSPMLSKTSVLEGPSSTIKFLDTADETLHSDSDIRDEIFTHATSIEISGKFIPKPHINNNKNSPMLLKTSVFEGPSSTSKFSDVVDETLHSDSNIHDEIFAHATSIERSDKFLPKPRINNKNSPMLSETSVFEGPSSTSKFSDAADVRNDLGDDLFHQPKTTTEISGKFHPMPRINKNRNPPMPSKTSASEAPSSTSKFHDIVDDEHVEKFQSEFQGITSSVSVNPVDVVSEYSQLDLLSLQNESFDAHGPNFSVGDLKARSYFPIYSSEDRACCSNINDLESQSLTENEGLAIMEGATRDHIGEPNLDECAPSIVQNDEAEKSSRKVRQGSKKLKTNIDNMAPTDQNTKNSILEMDDDYGGDGFMDDDIPKKKKRKLPKKSNSRSCENESSIKDPPKKRLQHGSSRCRSAKRQVNKALLEIPDDELDRRQLLIRDLIRLAGFKERISNKEAAALRNSFANQSTEHEQDLNGDDANGEIQQEGPRLNYHSYMRRPLQTRWSKTDTEIFYQAIRQFGTDFAMIQVLFPERSRQQVKAKFKNEQRKHPLQIADALVHRSKDHSHFEKVIEHLQAMAEQNSKNDAGDSTAQAQDEADQNEEEKMEANSKEEQAVNCFEDWDEDVHIPTKFNLSGNDFDQHSEAASEMENFWM